MKVSQEPSPSPSPSYASIHSANDIGRVTRLPLITRIFLCTSQFLYGSANACYYSFLSIWLSFNAFTYTQIGYVRGLNQLSVLLFVPPICMLIDALSGGNQPKRQLLFSLFCFAVALARLSFISWFTSWSVIFCVMIVVTVAVQESTNSVMDGIVLSMIPDPNKYGRYRLWAGFGWGITAFLLGLIFDRWLSVDCMHYFFAVLMGLLAAMWFIPSLKDLCCNPQNNKSDGYKSSLLIHHPKQQQRRRSSKHKAIAINNSEQNQENIGFCRKLCLFMRQITAFKLQLIFSIFILGAAFGVINTFLFLRLQEMGASTMLMGMTLVVTICSEIPAFLAVEHALRRIGDLGIICVGMLAYMLRLIWYGCLGLHGMLNNPWYVLPAELLHGLTYAWIKASIAVFAHRLANNEQMSPDDGQIDWSSFSQGLLSAIFNGLGQGLGSIVGGIVFDVYGPHWLFFGTAALLVPFFVIHCVQFCCCRRRIATIRPEAT